MIIGTKRLLELVKEKDLVKDLCERELTNPEGAGFDLRIGEVYALSGSGYLGIEKRATPEATLVAKYGKDNKYTLQPRGYVILNTIESVKLPENIVGRLVQRMTNPKSGVRLNHGEVAPGYEGKLSFGLENLRDEPFEFELGARIIHITFEETSENISKYRGQWNNGRISTQGKKEIQV